MATYGTTEHVGMPDASEIDWELVQYRCADRIVATSDLAAELLGDLGVDATVVRGDAPAAKQGQHRPAHRIYALGPVSRRNRSGDVLRSVASVDDASVVVSEDDTPDIVWTGTTWEANRAIRRILGERVTRSDRVPADTDLVVVGDPLMPPNSVLERVRASGVPIAARAQSVVATRWPDVRTWMSTDDLVEVISGATGAIGAQTSLPHTGALLGGRGRMDDRFPAEARARRVSVGIPAFGVPTHLDECVASVLAQTEPVHEVLIIDDGSRSRELDRALDRWQSCDERIVILRQANRGVCVARNTMLDAMRGDAFLLVDQDDVLDPSFIAATATALRADEGLAAAAAWTEFFGEYSAIEAKPPFDRRIAARENPIVSTAALVDMSVRDHGVRFEPDLAFLYCEDWNFWSQIVATGGRIGLVPAPLVKHRVHRASGGFQRTDVALRIGTARALAPLRQEPSPTD
jgi:GT2 family glycosyltransferase